MSCQAHPEGHARLLTCTPLNRGHCSLRRRTLHVVVVLLICSGLMVPSGNAGALVVDDVRSDANWILSAQLSDGGIANYIDRQAIWPYLANFAAMGLARAYEVTKDRRFVDAAWRWLSWYQARMDTQGFVTDYIVKDGKPVSTGFMDSTDAYAGTFLLALRDAYRANPSLSRLRTYRTGLTRAVKAIEATQTTDGLTWAKPTWRVKYLMDQAEVYAGLLAAVELANVLRDTTLSRRARADADRVRSGVVGLWNLAVAAYDWAVHGDGTRVPTDWSYLYSDALQQPWAVAFGLVGGARETELTSRFAAAQPDWARPDALALFRGGIQEKVGYWPVAGLALVRVGSNLAAPAVGSIRSAAVGVRRAWPFTTGNAGQLILFEASSLPGARTFDAKPFAPTSSSSTTSSSSPTPSPSASIVVSPSPTPAPSPSPTPTPTALVQFDAQVGPVSGGASVSGDGITVTASPAVNGSRGTPKR